MNILNISAVCVVSPLQHGGTVVSIVTKPAVVVRTLSIQTRAAEIYGGGVICTQQFSGSCSILFNEEVSLLGSTIFINKRVSDSIV